MSREDGIAGLVRQAASATVPAASEAEQQDLFVPPVTRHLGEGDAAFAERQERIIAEHRRGPGRPKGSRNVSTQEWRDFALRSAGGKHPLVEMLRWWAMGPQGLSEQLGCGMADAYDRWAVLGKELLPYLVAKQAPVDDQGKAVPGIGIFVGQQGLNTAAGGVPPWMDAFTTIDGEVIGPLAATKPEEPA
jgi:hypothetical protein